jgi:hypothetical protein
MKTLKYIIALGLFFSSLSGIAQTKEEIIAQAEEKDVFKKKFRFGVSWNQYWGTIKGSNLPKEYFGKPCVGASLRAEYYPLSFMGIGVGFGVQQRGAGIINPDNYGGSFTHPWEPNYDPDSTYRERLRMNTIEVPVTLLLRTPKDVFKGVRLSGAAGIVWIKNDYVKEFWHKPEDGFHTIINVEDDYIKQDLGYQLSLGADINCASQSVFQVHLVYTKGTKNIYKTGSGDGRVETYGFRLAWLY